MSGRDSDKPRKSGRRERVGTFEVAVSDPATLKPVGTLVGTIDRAMVDVGGTSRASFNCSIGFRALGEEHVRPIDPDLQRQLAETAREYQRALLPEQERDWDAQRQGCDDIDDAPDGHDRGQ